jgi:hypothetical protein
MMVLLMAAVAAGVAAWVLAPLVSGGSDAGDRSAAPGGEG